MVDLLSRGLTWLPNTSVLSKLARRQARISSTIASSLQSLPKRLSASIHQYPSGMPEHADEPENAEDILNDALAFLGGRPIVDDGRVHYGQLTLTVAPKEGKANTLLADHLFSPALLLAERIERGLVPVNGRKIVELGAGCALPSLLSATLPDPPSLVVVTDYPDDGILGNLQMNVERSQNLITPGCSVHCRGYEWGADVQTLVELLPADSSDPPGFDMMILSDLLHFHSSHNVLIDAITSLLSKSAPARVYVAAGKYTSADICDHFLHLGRDAGISFVEGETESQWLGTLEVSGLDREQLGVRKRMCRWWVGRWAECSEEQASETDA